MSYYDWYTAPSPKQVREMPFTNLFGDCFAQARRAYRAVLPKLTGGMVGDNDSTLETSNVPEPQNLGDLVKLFGLATDAAPQEESDCVSGLDFGPVAIHAIDSNNTELVLDILKKSFKFSRASWQQARRGEFSTIGAWPDHRTFARNEDDKANEENAKQFLNLMVIGRFQGTGAQCDYESFERDLLGVKSPTFNKILIRLAALVSCDIGISALEWSGKRMTPIVISKGEHELLGLISSSTMIQPMQTERSISLAHPLNNALQISYRHFVRTLPEGGFKSRHRCVGLVPAFYGDCDDMSSYMKRHNELGFTERHGKMYARLISLI